MSLYIEIKNDKFKALKFKNRLEKNLLTSIISDVDKYFKDTCNSINDQKIVEILIKYSKSIEENLSILKSKKFNKIAQIIEYDKELEILNRYLPKKLTNKELKTIIINILNNGEKNIGYVMKNLKENYNGKYDGKEAKKIILDII